jgi:hypothetical protein
LILAVGYFMSFSKMSKIEQRRDQCPSGRRRAGRSDEIAQNQRVADGTTSSANVRPPRTESHSYRFVVELRNSAGVLPQLDISTVGHLLSTFLRRVVIDALEVDSFNVMAVRGDKIRSIV